MTIDSLQAQAYHSIRRKIIYADLKPGQKISEKELELLLKIGRTPIREALIQLGQQDLVYTIPQSGTYISKINLSSAENARFIREILERKVMVECCAKMTNQTKTILSTILEQEQKAVENKNERDFFQTDNLFHETCFEIANRQKVWSWIDDHNTNLERYRWLRVTVEGLDWNTIMNQHYRLFDALVEKDTEQVDFLTATHLHMMPNEQDSVVKHYPDYFEK